MSEMKKFMSIVRLGHKSTIGVLNVGDEITITEKVDGANASFKRDGNKVLAYSRENQLSEHMTLNGFWQWTQELVASKLLDGVIYFGEWTVKHKVSYGENMKKFFLFDIYNTHLEEYVDFSMVENESRRLGINLIPLFYKGKYQSFEHLESFVGKTQLSGKLGDVETGEGIVVKNVKYKNKYGNQIFVKLVTEDFIEVQKQKPYKDPSIQSPEMMAVSQCLTKHRVEKIIFKLIDENAIDPVLKITDIGNILRAIGNKVYDDIIKEESELFEAYIDKDIQKCIGKKLPLIVKQIIGETVAA